MLYEFAITPEVFDPSIAEGDAAIGVTLVTVLRELTKDGLIANLDKESWMKVVRDRVPGLEPVLRDKIMSCLRVLADRHRFVRHPRSPLGNPSSDLDWLKLALHTNGPTPLDGIVVSDALKVRSGLSDSILLELGRILDSHAWLDRKRSHNIEKTFRAIQCALKPVLRYARSLSLVDPYLKGSDAGFMGIVDLCSELMGDRPIGRLPGRVRIHTGIDSQRPEGHESDYYLNLWESQLREFSRRDGHKFDVKLWRRRPFGENFHDRYVLTDQCGISIAGGLRIPNDGTPGSTTWCLLDEQERVLNLEKVDRGSSPFEFIAERTVSSS